MAKQWDSSSSDNYDLISVPSRDLRTPHYDCSSKDSTHSFEKSFEISTPSQDSKLPSSYRRSLLKCSASSDNCYLISIPSRNLRTPHCDCSFCQKIWLLWKIWLKSLRPHKIPDCLQVIEDHSQDTRISPIDSRSSYDCNDFIFSTEEDCSNPDDSQLLQSTEKTSKEDKGSRCTLSRRKSYSMKDGAVRSRALYERRAVVKIKIQR